jgi:two-component system sensor histidine kinase DegS
LTSQLSAIRKAIDGILTAIREGREQIEWIAESTQSEMNRLEQECQELQNLCLEAIERVETLEQDEKRAREKLMIVHGDVNRYTERDMQQAYEHVQQLQAELAQWREREHQLRIRRDDTLRRLKVMRMTAQRAEILTLKFHHIADFLSGDIEQFSSALHDAHLQSLLGIQILQMQEAERETLARELHDGPIQALATASMRLQVRMAGNDALKPIREEFRTEFNQVIGQLRKTLFRLRPPLLDDLGIVPALKRYTDEWSHSTGIPVRHHLMGLEVSLTPTEKITVFRCVQEALDNVRAHSGGSRVDLTVFFKEKSVEFTVEDDGIGIPEVDWTGWLQEGKSGLNLCRQKLQLLGGTLGIQKRSTQGTQVRIELPIVRGEVAT